MTINLLELWLTVHCPWRGSIESCKIRVIKWVDLDRTRIEAWLYKVQSLPYYVLTEGILWKASRHSWYVFDTKQSQKRTTVYSIDLRVFKLPLGRGSAQPLHSIQLLSIQWSNIKLRWNLRELPQSYVSLSMNKTWDGCYGGVGRKFYGKGR